MLVQGVPEWPQDLQGHRHRGPEALPGLPPGRRPDAPLSLLRLRRQGALCRRRSARITLIATFAGLSCLPYADGIGRAQPIGPFNSFSNEDHWIEDPTAPGVVLVGDAAGHNDPISARGSRSLARRPPGQRGHPGRRPRPGGVPALRRGTARAHAAAADHRVIGGDPARRIRRGGAPATPARRSAGCVSTRCCRRSRRLSSGRRSCPRPPSNRRRSTRCSRPDRVLSLQADVLEAQGGVAADR